MDDDFDHVPAVDREGLTQFQAIDYDEHRRQFYEWLTSKGKDPRKEKGLAATTSENYMARVAQFYRWVWEKEGQYTLDVTTDHADRFVEELNTDEICCKDGKPYSETSKRKKANAVEKLFEWLADDPNDYWKPKISFTDDVASKPETFTREELNRLDEAVLDYGTIPKYNDLSPEERDRWKGYLAQREGIPKSSVTPEHWEKRNASFKFQSLFSVSLDAALRPVEVERAKPSWLKLENERLEIPKEDSAKNRDDWTVGIRPRTARFLKQWLSERENYPKYDGRDELWLTREGNPFGSGTLNYHLEKLCKQAGIDWEERDLKWYSIRYSVATQINENGDLTEVQAQLRHKCPETTMHYVTPSAKSRTETLSQIY